MTEKKTAATETPSPTEEQAAPDPNKQTDQQPPSPPGSNDPEYEERKEIALLQHLSHIVMLFYDGDGQKVAGFLSRMFVNYMAQAMTLGSDLEQACEEIAHAVKLDLMDLAKIRIANEELRQKQTAAVVAALLAAKFGGPDDQGGPPPTSIH